MKNYTEIERALRALPNIETVRPYRCNNFITPNVIGFIPINKNVKAEISYGTAFGGGYCIGVTLFEKKYVNQTKYFKMDSDYNKCFMDNEINQISEYLKTL